MGRRRRLLPGDLASISVQSAGGMILVTLVATAMSLVVSLMLVIATAVPSQVYPVYGVPLAVALSLIGAVGLLAGMSIV